MYGFTVTPATIGIDPVGARDGFPLASPEPEKSFADYLAELDISREGISPEGTQSRVAEDRRPPGSSSPNESEEHRTRLEAEESAHEQRLRRDAEAAETESAKDAGDVKDPGTAKDSKDVKDAGHGEDAKNSTRQKNEAEESAASAALATEPTPDKPVTVKEKLQDESDDSSGDDPRRRIAKAFVHDTDKTKRSGANDAEAPSDGKSRDRVARARAEAARKEFSHEKKPGEDQIRDGAGVRVADYDVTARDNADLREGKHRERPEGDNSRRIASLAGENAGVDRRIRGRSGENKDAAERKSRDELRGIQRDPGDARANRRTVRSAEDTRRTQSDNDRTVREILVNLQDEGASDRENSSGSETRSLLTRVDSLPGEPGGRTGATGSIPDAAQHLARRLNGSLGDNIVRQARVILKDSDRGEIRLVIRPPELGRVRIQLQMDQGHIAGRILVDNQNVRQAIEQNLAALQRAFQEAGLEMGELEVSTGDARQDSRGESDPAGSAHSRGEDDRGADQFGRQVKSPVEFDYGHRRINLVA